MGMALSIERDQFALKTASLFGHVADEHWIDPASLVGGPSILWALEVEPEGSYDYPPRFTCDTMRFPVRRWTDLSGSSIHFQGPYPYLDNARALSVMNEWDEVPHATLQILNRKEALFNFRLEGVCILNEEVPFLIEGQALFKEIQVWGSAEDTVETFTQRLASHIDVSEFREGVIRGGRYCVFEPKT